MHIGIIGGSGFYKLTDSSTAKSMLVGTPYGSPSGSIHKQEVGSNTVFFLPRHGEGHRISPSEINYRANIYALKKLGVSCVISVSAVGSMKKEIRPGDFVLPSQYIDMTRGLRPNTFFGQGVVAHAHFADPTCKTLREHIAVVAKRLGIGVHVGGTYVCIEGPQFSTRSESHLYRSWNIPGGVSVIGMTALPEARLAREAGLCYQTVATATDYDCWNEDNEDVTVEAILKVLRENADTSRTLVHEIVSKAIPSCHSHCKEMMGHAIVTAKELWPKSKLEELEVIIG